MTGTLADENRAYFDNFASQYGEKQWHRDLADNVTEELRNKLDFIGIQWAAKDERNPVRLLDYACGTGMVTRALGPYVTQTCGIDVSSGMARKYNEIARHSNVSTETAEAHVGNLFATPPDPTLDIPMLYNFDIAVVGFGFHHFDDYNLATRRLAERVKPDGVVLIIDLIDDGRKFEHHANHTMHRHGFSEAEVKQMFETEGLVDVGTHILDKPMIMNFEGKEIRRTIFFARAFKPSA